MTNLNKSKQLDEDMWLTSSYVIRHLKESCEKSKRPTIAVVKEAARYIEKRNAEIKQALSDIKALRAELSETKKEVNDMETRAMEAEAERDRLQEIIFGTGVNLWYRAELTECDKNGSQSILLWHLDDVPVLTLKTDSHAPALTPTRIEFLMSGVLHVLMDAARAKKGSE